MFTARQQTQNPLGSSGMQLEMALKNSPRKLYEKFCGKLNAIKLIHDDMFRHPYSELINRCFYEMSAYQFPIVNPCHDEKFFQKKYLELCGMVWTLQESLAKCNKLSQQEDMLKQQLSEVLKQMLIKKDQDLPVINMRVGQNCVAYYQSLHPVKATDEYINALVNLQMHLKNPEVSDELDLQCKKLIVEIESLKSESESDKNMSYCAMILRETTSLLRPPSGYFPQYEKYMNLANEAPGKPSKWKKVTGAMFLIASTLACLTIISLSIAATVFSAGGAIPFSFAGISYAVGILSSIAGMLIGTGFSAAGQRESVSRAMKDCHDSAKKPIICPDQFYDETRRQLAQRRADNLGVIMNAAHLPPEHSHQIVPLRRS